MKKFCLSIIALAFVITGQAQKTDISKVEWLVGSWQGTYNNKPFYEAWRKINDAMLINLTIEINGTDTVIKENGVIRISPNESFFHGKDAKWSVLELSDTVILLGNDTIRYANRIRWSHTPNDHWLTIIENPKSVVRYDLVKIPWLDNTIDLFITRMRGKKQSQ